MITAIIVAAGSGTRMGGEIPKQYMALGERKIIEHTLAKFAFADETILVINPNHRRYTENLCVKIAEGGETRQESVYKALKAANPATDIVLIHDGVRPFVKKEYIDQVIEKARLHGGAILAVPVKSTIKHKKNGKVTTVERTDLWAAQTPQGFKYDIILKAYHENKDNLHNFTDDSSLSEKAGNVYIVEGCESNIKITTKADLEYGEYLLRTHIQNPYPKNIAKSLK